jgi:primosomal protein N' (replication factor Y)
MTLVARIRFSSPLPQLDKEFDYLVPNEIHSDLAFGHLVEVPFGSGGKLKTGVVCRIQDEANPREKLLSIKRIVSSLPVFTPSQLELCIAVAERQAGSVGELLSVCIPKRYSRAESKYSESHESVSPGTAHPDIALAKALKKEKRVYFRPNLFDGGSSAPDWALKIATVCLERFNEGQSSLVVLPDFAELARFERALDVLGISKLGFRHSSSDTGSERYSKHLASINRIGINFGLRSSSFSPAKNLGLITIWDDGDESHIEQTAPYWNSREVLLQRAELEGCELLIASHSPSSEVIRLIEIGYLSPHFSQQEKSQVVVTNLSDRLDAQTFALISTLLANGKPVLMQIANAGWATALVCVGCREVKKCPGCSGSVWVDPSGRTRCRSCKTQVETLSCICGKTSTRPTRLGSSAIAKQMERSFPAATVLHSNGEVRITNVKSGALLVVSTPGAEPEVEGGYACIVLADAPGMVGSPRLRALEQSLSKWANAISLAHENATIVFVGLRDKLAEQMKSLAFHEAVTEDYKDREDLGLPPTRRIASVLSSNPLDHQRFVEAIHKAIPADMFRTISVLQPNTLVLDFQYSSGKELANILKELAANLTSSSKAKKPGERVYRINMDDSKVI